jgi:uncharacterized membrane protein YqiK
MGINPLENGKAKADFKKAEIEIQQYKAQLELKANRQLNDAENKVSLLCLI